MPSALSRKDLLTIRTDALHLAASFYSENLIPELSDLWKLASFFEAFMTAGAEALREQYAPPRPKAKTTVLKLANPCRPIADQPQTQGPPPGPPAAQQAQMNGAAGPIQ